MEIYTQGDTRPVLDAADTTRYQNNGSLIIDSRRTRPLWFDGRFLAARDLAREQDYSLQREADLARASGFGRTHGLLVETVPADSQTITINRGQGLTPAGELVSVPAAVTLQLSDLVEEAALDVQFGLSASQTPDPSTRTGLYVLALKPVQFTANPISAYPTTISGPFTGPPATHDGDLIEATAVALVPYPNPSNNGAAATAQAALARQIFATANTGQLPYTVLPLAMLSLQNGAIEWLDTYMVRREPEAEYTGFQFGLTDPQNQQAFLLEYDACLQQAVTSFTRQNRPARFAATDYFQALPPAGRFPLATIETDAFTQQFFPPQIDVRLSIIPDDELAALIEDSLALPPIDLTLDPAAYQNLAIFALVPVPRSGFTALSAALPAVQLTTILPQVLNNRRPIDLLQFYRGTISIPQPSGTDDASWQAAFGTQTYGYYIRRQSSAIPVVFSTLVAIVLSSVSPATAVAGDPDLTLTVIGSGFLSAATVTWNGAPVPTTVVSPTELTATVPAELLATAGTFSLAVSGPDETSPALPFVIVPRVTITGLSPATVVAESPIFTLTVDGSAFTASTVICWNTNQLGTTFASATQVTAAIPADLLLFPASVSITVQGSGQTSDASPFVITPAQLVVNSISPTTIALAYEGIVLLVNGSGFSAATEITWNGAAVSTTLNSDTQMQTAIASYQLTPAGDVPVGVSAPNLPSPAPLVFTITPLPPPSLSYLFPSYALAGETLMSFVVTGAGFPAGAQITWNGNPMDTQPFGSNLLGTGVAAVLLQSSGSATIGVYIPGVPFDNFLPFEIGNQLITITAISQTSAIAGGPDVPITITAASPTFTETTTINWSVQLNFNSAFTAELDDIVFVDAQHMTATIPTAFLVEPASANIFAQQSQDGIRVSNYMSFSVNPVAQASEEEEHRP